jgi:hypothetical protein
MNNIYKNSYTYQEAECLYLIHDEFVVVFEGEKLITTMLCDLKKEFMTESVSLLMEQIKNQESFNLLAGKVTLNRTDDILDEYQLQAYAKEPSSTANCPGGAVFANGPTMADDGSCAPTMT